jgi:tetratricopeptide (TPR) repeat protein
MNKLTLQTLLRFALLSFSLLYLTSNSLHAADISTITPAAKPAVVNALQTGRDAVKAKDWEKAIVQFKLATVQEPKNADAYNMLAYSYRKQTKPDLPKAFENYNLALRLDPKHKGAHEYVGEAYLMDNKPDEAEKHLALLATICSNKTCEEYADLEKAINVYKNK